MGSMTDTEYPSPLSDPESDGLPGVADDDSSAYDEVETGREADGERPAALPGNRPTPGETDTLAERLHQEEPEGSADGDWVEPGRPIGRLVAVADGGVPPGEAGRGGRGPGAGRGRASAGG